MANVINVIIVTLKWWSWQSKTTEMQANFRDDRGCYSSRQWLHYFYIAYCSNHSLSVRHCNNGKQSHINSPSPKKIGSNGIPSSNVNIIISTDNVLIEKEEPLIRIHHWSSSQTLRSCQLLWECSRFINTICNYNYFKHNMTNF